MRKIVGLWVMFTMCTSVPVLSQVDTSYIYNTSTSYGTLDLRIRKSDTRYYYLQEGVTFSFRESAPGVKTNTYHDMTSWDSSPYQQGNLREKNGTQDLFIMNYRFKLPENYNPEYDPGYPIILMLHGYGERGNCWFDQCYWSTTGWNPNTNSPAAPTTSTHVLLNNDHNLLHGGNPHLNAVKRAGSKLPDDPTLEPNAFPGFVLFPQVMNGWQTNVRVEDAIKLLRLIIKKYNIDENRVYIHGLSNGGGGVFQAIKRAPWLFAAALGMSVVSNGNIPGDGLAPEVGKLPMWVFQGGKDTNPTPSRTYNTVKLFREAGADIRLTYYPNLGHGTWNSAYNEPDFFSWILSKQKNQPHVFYGNPVICNTNGAGVRIGYSNGFLAYQWELDGVIVSSATTSEFVVNTPGTVRGRFSRKANPSEADWEPWSEPIVVTEISPEKPTIVAIGSTHLRGPGLISSTENNTVVLKSSTKAELYTWYKNGVPVEFAGTDVHDTLRTAIITSAGSGANGAYTVSTSFSYCPSPPSDPVYVFFNNSAPQNMTIDPVAAQFKAAIMESGVMLSWNDLVSKETGYEVWRKKSTDTNFVFAGKAPKDALLFYDKPLQPNTTYQYKLRAVGNTGVSNYLPSNTITDVLQITTPADTEPPLAPQELKVLTNTINSITLSWKAAEDNAAIQQYVIDYGTGVVQTDSSLTTFIITDLPPNNLFAISVKAVDFCGLMSPFSNQVIGSTYVLGLKYKHSTGAWEDLDDPTMVATWADPEFTGTVNNFSLTPRTQDDFFNFQYMGYIDIPETGQYMLRLASGDGSRLILDDSVQIDNDGIHGNKTMFSDTLLLTKGPHPIEVQYFDYAGAHTLTVNYKGPNLSNTYKPIPDSLLRSGKFVPPVAPSPPTNLAATANGMERVDLAWTSAGTHVEIYRSLAQDGTYTILGKSSTGTFVDTLQALPGKTYFYKARVITSDAVSAFSNIVSATTATDAIPPTTPGNVTLMNKSHTVVSISWTASTDNTQLSHYEILANNEVIGTSEITSFMAIGLLPNSTYTFTVVAVDANDNKSSASAGLIVTTNPSAMFYSLASGNLNELTSWKQNPNGTGNSPVDFAENGQYFVIANRTVTGIGGSWDVSGSASKVIIPTNVTLNVDHEFIGAVELEGNAVLNLNYATAPEFQKISATSTINFNGYADVPAKTYGNVSLSGVGGKNFTQGTTIIMGNLSVADGIILRGASANASQVTVAGNISINGSQGFNASDNRLGLHLTGNTSHTISTGGNLYFYSLVADANAIVNVNVTADPVKFIFGSLNGGGLLLASGSVLNMGSSSLETIGAATINPSNETGVVAINGGDFRFRSTAVASSNVYFDVTSHLVDSLLVDVSASGGVFIKSPVDVQSALMVNHGTISGGGYLRLLSNSSGTAQITVIGSDGIIAGEIKVQQYLAPQGTSTRELSTAVNGVTVSKWQTFFPITGPFTGSSGGTEPSLFVSNGNALVEYPASGGTNQSPIEKGRGYAAKISSATPITIEVSGAPFQQNVSFPLVGGSSLSTGWNLVGNPFASEILWSENAESWIRSGVSRTIAVKENKSINGQTVGQYHYFNSTINNGVIKPGQAFWVQAYTSTPSLTITEKAKNVTGVDSSALSHLTVSMTQGVLTDNTYILFAPDALDALDGKYDFGKRLNEGMFNLSSVAGTDMLSVNTLPNSFCSKSVNLNIQNAAPGSYTLNFSGLESLVDVGTVSLRDNFLGSTVSVTSTGYGFNVTSDPNSFGAGRFTLTFSRQALDKSTPKALGENVCSGDFASVMIIDPQPGVNYVAINGSGAEISEPSTGDVDTLLLQVPVSALTGGTNHIRILAGFPGCTSEMLTSETDLNYTPSFEISVQEDLSVCLGDQAMLSASGVPADGHYRWFDADGVAIDSVTDGSLLTLAIVEETVFQVMGVLSGGCESPLKTIHVYSDTLGTPDIVLQNDTLFTQVLASYQWHFNGQPIQSATEAYYLPTQSGNYSVIASSSGCGKESEPFEFVVDPDCLVDIYTPSAAGSDVCGHGIATITISNSQQGVTYTVLDPEGEVISESQIGNGGSVLLIVGTEALDSGANTLSIETDMEGCANRMLNSKATVGYTPEFHITSEDSVVVCSGDQAVLSASGVPDGGNYSWLDDQGAVISTGVASSLTIGTVTSDRTYFVSGVHPLGCKSDTVQISVKALIIPLPVVTMEGDSMVVTGEDTYQYQWQQDGAVIPGATASKYKPAASGNYTVVVTQGMCSEESLPFEYLITGIEQGVVSEFVLHAYPVPASKGNLNIRVQSPKPESIMIRVINITGRTLYQRTFALSELAPGIPLDRNGIPVQDGIYYVIATQGRLEVRKKIVVRN
jgi:predicted esterase/chitodextrinase